MQYILYSRRPIVPHDTACPSFHDVIMVLLFRYGCLSYAAEDGCGIAMVDSSSDCDTGSEICWKLERARYTTSFRLHRA